MALADRCSARECLRQAPRRRHNLPNGEPLRHGYPNGRPVSRYAVRDGPSNIIGRVSIADASAASPQRAIPNPNGQRDFIRDLESAGFTSAAN
jgi:hypothetical protein